MGSWSIKVLWSFTLLLAGAEGQRVEHPDQVCAVFGSTVTLPCTFSPLPSITKINERVSLRVIRVRWCRNHLICHGTTPSVYDSEWQNNNNNARYRYLGNLQDNCTLQIVDVQRTDEAVLRFRMEVNYTEGHYTEQSGVSVAAVEWSQPRVEGPNTDTQLSSGQAVTLYCTSDCTFHRLEVAWFRDDHALPESGPALRLEPLTAEHSGNYTCALRNKIDARSQPYSLFVTEGLSDGNNLMTAVVVSGVLLALSALILSFFIIRRKLAAADKDQRAEAEEAAQQHHDDVYSSVLQPAELEVGGQAPEDVNYVSVQFTQRNHTRRAEPDHVIYTSLSHYPPVAEP